MEKCYRILNAITVAIAVFALVSGCGGGGGGDGDDNDIDPGTSLIGSWQPVSAKQDSTPIALSEVMPSANSSTRLWKLDFNQNGTVVFRTYDAGNNNLDNLSGTWSSDNQIAPVKLTGLDTTNISWSTFDEDLMTVQYAVDGHPVEAKWVRLTTLPMAEHSPALAKAWTVTQVKKDNVVTPTSEFFSWPAGADKEVITFQSGGTIVFQALQAAVVVDTENETWSTRGILIAFTFDGSLYRGYWNILGPNLVITVWDPITGKTVEITASQ